MKGIKHTQKEAEAIALLLDKQISKLSETPWVVRTGDQHRTLHRLKQHRRFIEKTYGVMREFVNTSKKVTKAKNKRGVK